jgi:nucleoside 2-deoxyribosyltransferase
MKVYIAGAYSGPDVLTVMANMRRGLKLSAAALKAGFSVYSPWCDCLLHFEQEFTLSECYRYSMEWLEVSDAVLVVPEHAKRSHGVQAELERANQLFIPIFWSLADLKEWRDGVLRTRRHSPEKLDALAELIREENTPRLYPGDEAMMAKEPVA